jgi:hypothetical protein
MEIEWDCKQTIFKIWGFKNKILLFAFVRQCLSKNLTEIHLNRVINYLTESWWENELKKWTWNVILTKTLKMTRDFSQFFLLLCSASSWEPNFCIKMYFFINTNLIYVDLLYKRLSYRVKRQFIWSFQTFSLFPYKMRKI